MAPPNTTQQMMDTQQLMQGFNAMQAQAGLVPGNAPFSQTQHMQPMQQPQSAAHPSQASERIKVQFLQNQPGMQGGTAPNMGSVAPVRRPTPFENAIQLTPPDLPQARFGTGAMMARQRAVASTNENIAGVQAGLGAGTRGMATAGIAGVGTGMGMMTGTGPLPGIAGATAFEHFGFGQQVQDFSSSMMTPIVQQRQKALQLQNMSMGHVIGGNNLSATGMGLSARASTKLAGQLTSMADSAGFQQETGGAFNRKDVMKITNLAGEMGMLDQDQTTNQIKDSVRKISKGLKNFMDVMENPDMKEAMRMMGQMKELGMSVEQSQMAATNARTFARMAGTTPEGVMQGGMQGANEYQRRGLSGATGLQAGMAAQGMGGVAGSILPERQLALLGGKEGVADAFTKSAAKAGTMDAILPGMLKKGAGGQLTVDSEQISRFMSGDVSMQDAVRDSASRMRQFGSKGIQDLATRRRELQDEIQQQLGPMGQTLMPLMQARALMKDTGMDLGGALATLSDQGVVGEKQARALESMAESPDFYNTIRKQMRVQEREKRKRVAEESERIQEAAEVSEPRRMFEQISGGVTGRITETLNRFSEGLAETQDLEEAGAMSGGIGRVIRANKFTTKAQQARTRELGKTREGREQMAAAAARQQEAITRRIGEEAELPIGRTDTPIIGGILRQGFGPHGFGFSEAARGGQHIDDMLLKQEEPGMLGRAAGLMFPEPTEEVRKRAKDKARFGKLIEQTRKTTATQSVELDKQARESVPGMGKKEYREVKAEAVGNALSFVKSKKNFFGGMEDFTEEDIKKNVIQKMKEQGVPNDQIESLRNNKSFWKSVISDVSDQGDETVQAGLEKVVEEGGALSGALEGQTRDQALADITAKREEVLESIGLEGGFLSGISKGQQDAAIDALTSKSDGHGMERRKLIAAKAMMKSEDKETAKRGRILYDKMKEKLPEKERNKILKEVDESAKRIGDEGLRRMGEEFGKTRNEKELEGGLNVQGGKLKDAQLREGALHTRDVFGEDIAKQIMDGNETVEDQAVALEELVEEEGAGAIKDEKVRKLAEEGEYTKAVHEAYSRGSGKAGSRGKEAEVSGVKGIRQAAGLAGSGNVLGALSVLQKTFLGGEDEEEKKDKDKPDTPKTLEEAVPLFSEASTKLLKAAEAFEGSSSMDSMGSIAKSATDGMLNPVSAVLGLFGGD